jgi:hypothetical protein
MTATTTQPLSVAAGFHFVETDRHGVTLGCIECRERFRFTDKATLVDIQHAVDNHYSAIHQTAPTLGDRLKSDGERKDKARRHLRDAWNVALEELDIRQAIEVLANECEKRAAEAGEIFGTAWLKYAGILGDAGEATDRI